jgi:hypothetical protein
LSRPATALCCLLFTFAAQAGALPYGPPQRVDPATTGDGAIGDQFGRALARSGTTLVVGARQVVLVSPDAPEGIQSGAAFVYENVAGALQPVQRVVAPAPGEDDLFGEAIALAGDLLLVGASGTDGDGFADRGAAHLFRRGPSGFVHEATLAPPQPEASLRFGAAVAVLDGDTVAIGMPREANCGATLPGRVAVFRRVGGTWTAVVTLASPQAAGGDGFGAALAAQGDRLLVGQPCVAGPGPIAQAGAVDVFDSGTGFAAAGRLVEPVAAERARFGGALRLDADLAVVGAPGDLASVRGFARIYARSGGLLSPVQRIEAGDIVASDGFGFALDREGDTLLVGAPGRFAGDGGGHVFIREAGTFVQRALLEDRSIPEGGGLTGIAVALFGGRALLGADLAIVLPNRAQGAVRTWLGSGATWTPGPRLDRGDGAAGEFFGFALAVDGTQGAVGSFLDDTATGGDDAGSVSVFARGDGGWQRTQRVQAPDGAPEDWFGRSVALAGDWLVVGAPRDITGGGTALADTGSVSVFRRVGGTWAFACQLLPADGSGDDNFGFSLAFDGVRLLVAAPGRDDGAIDRGAAYAWTVRPECASWRFDGKLVPQQAPPGALAGISIALDGDLAVLGAPQAAVAGRAAQGLVARFRFDGAAWQEQSPVLASDGAAGDLFGASVALAPGGARLAVGGSGVRLDAMNSNVGAAWVFALGAGVAQEARLQAATPEAGAGLGAAVALSGDLLAVGASGEDTGGVSNLGRVHLWRRVAGAWTPAGTLAPADGTANSFFGRTLTADFGTLAVGGPLRALGDNPAAGSAWLYPDAENLFADGFE